MDYQRIYSDFIADRKRREAHLIGYSERHHIHPRALGGGDEASNLIRLIPEDHFFAHLLLAKIHGGQMWAPVAFMVGGQRKDWRPCNSRRAYAWAVREMAKARLGAGAYQFDTTVYRLEHVDGSRWAGRQSDMPELGFSRAMANLLIKRRCRSAKGWFIEGERPEHVGRGRGGGLRHAMADLKEYSFRHVDGRLFTGTQIAMRARHGLRTADTTKLVRGVQTISKGWHLDGVTPKTAGRARAYAR